MGSVGAEVREGTLDVPVTAGFLSPVILLPAGWRSLAPEGGRSASARVLVGRT